MTTRRLGLASLTLLGLSGAALAQPLPVLQEKSSLLIDPRGPSAAVTALAFDAGGTALFAAGLDKVVRVWTLDKNGATLRPEQTRRVPVGPGNAGSLNAVALSPDGKWLAMAGRSPMRGEARFQRGGMIVPSSTLTPEQNEDAGLIYVASTANPAGGKMLRGHRGEVRALAFAPAHKDKPPVLLSAATERDKDRRFGGLRLWDAASGKLLAQRNDLPARIARPGLAVWHTGDETAQIRAVVAWPDEDGKKNLLRLWEPGRERVQSWESDPRGQTAALIGVDNVARILSGGLGAESGRVRIWKIGNEAEAALDGELAFPPREKVAFLPVGLTVFPARGNAPVTHAAVVLQPGANEDFRLAIVDLVAKRVVADLPLAGSDRTQLPAVAASADDLAVAATRDHAIHLYKLRDLLAGHKTPAHVLAGEGLAPRQVAFANKGTAVWVSEAEQPQHLSRGVLLDFDKRQARIVNGADLAADTPKVADGVLEFHADRKGVTVHLGDKAVPVRVTGTDEVITAAALRPASATQSALLAVAYTERDAARTLIMLCDPALGKPFRLLVSHLHDVRGLAFSASRPLLASVAEDQTVCVWSLDPKDLDRAVGQVPGLGVGDDDGKVLMRRIEAGSPVAKAGLAPGDVLEKIAVANGEARPLRNAADFLLTVGVRKPGEMIEVTAAGKGVVKLPVERGVDERKPLFSLFLLRGGLAPQWVGWSPAGPYDASSPVAEKHLGRHTNTGDAAAPVEYVPVSEHRKDLYREGILGDLAREADLARALRSRPVPPPVQPSLRPIRPEQAQPTERAGVYQVREAVKSLRIGINADYNLDDQHVLRWRAVRTDGEKATADAAEATGTARRDGPEWEPDLAKLAWRRGDYQVRVALHAGADRPELTSTVITLRFRPPAPALSVKVDNMLAKSSEQEPLTVAAESVRLEIAVTTPVGQKVDVRFAGRINGREQKEVPAARPVTGSERFAESLKLQEGLNRLTIRALNQGANDGDDSESAAVDVWVKHLSAKPELPPSVTGLRLDPAPEVTRIGGSEVWIVERPAARLTGKIEAKTDLTLADWSFGGEPKSLLPAEKRRELPFSIDLELKPGERAPVRVRAKTERSEATEIEQVLVYQPPLPVIGLDPLPKLSSAAVLSEKFLLTGTVQAATADEFEVVFRVTSADGNKEFKPVIDRKAGTWKAELTLAPGSNSVKAFMSNRWRGVREIDTGLDLRYAQPPRITACPETVEAVETNRIVIKATVEGPIGRPLTDFQVDGRSVRQFRPGNAETRGGRWVWQLEIPVFVTDGDRNLDAISLSAISDEGASEPKVVRVAHRTPKVPAARFLRPTTDDLTQRAAYAVQFRVESRLPLEWIEIYGAKKPYRAELAAMKKEGDLFVFDGAATVELKPGLNNLDLVAVNQEGRSPAARVVVTLVEPAVLVSIDRVEVMSANGSAVEKVLRPTLGPDGAMTLPPAPGGFVWLVGRLRWSDPKAKALDDPGLQVSARVGDCAQFPVALEPRNRADDERVRNFRVPLTLNREHNRVRIEVPSVGQQEPSRRQFEIACARPMTLQRLHLLIVGVDMPDQAKLKNRVLDALGVEPGSRPSGSQGEFKKPAFERCVLYYVLTGDVERGQVEAEVLEINRGIKRLQRETGWQNDVVLIYYQGRDLRVDAKNEHWLMTSRNNLMPDAAPQKFAIPCHDLPRISGAQFLLLNVGESPEVHVAANTWGGNPDIGLMRYACMGAANPTVLDVLQDGFRKNGRLGDVAKYVKSQLGRQPKQFSPLDVLDEDQSSRQLGQAEK